MHDSRFLALPLGPVPADLLQVVRRVQAEGEGAKGVATEAER